MKEHKPEKMGSNELARAAGMSPGAVSKLLNEDSAKERGSMEFATAIKLAHALGASLDYVAYGTGAKWLTQPEGEAVDGDMEESHERDSFHGTDD